MNEELLLNMARAQMAEGKVQDALTILTAAIRQYPDSADLYIERGRVYREIGNQEAALFDIRKAAQINPEFVSGISGQFA